MKLRRAEGVEQYQSKKAVMLVYIFYSVNLLIWSIWEYALFGKLGMQFIILCLGQIIYFFSIYMQKKSINN